MTNAKTLPLTNTRMLLLAAAASMAFGIGTAMAQSQVPSAAQGAYFSQAQTQQQATPKTAKGFWGRIEAGASDIGHAHAGHTLPFNGDYGDLANPG
jgi:hypothetical protein